MTRSPLHIRSVSLNLTVLPTRIRTVLSKLQHAARQHRVLKGQDAKHHAKAEAFEQAAWWLRELLAPVVPQGTDLDTLEAELRQNGFSPCSEWHQLEATRLRKWGHPSKVFVLLEHHLTTEKVNIYTSTETVVGQFELS